MNTSTHLYEEVKKSDYADTQPDTPMHVQEFNEDVADTPLQVFVEREAAIQGKPG